MRLRVLVVEADDPREHVWIGRQIARTGAVKADAPEIEVLVTVPVLPEQHVRIGAREPVHEDRSVGLAGDGRAFVRSSRGATQTFMTPSTAAIQASQRPSGESLGLRALAFSKNVLRGMSGMSV